MAETRRDTTDPEIILGLLASIERDSGVTQRKLAGELGIALGLGFAVSAIISFVISRRLGLIDDRHQGDAPAETPYVS